MNIIKYIALFYLLTWIFEIIYIPFVFGEERGPYSPSLWLSVVIFNLPMIWILYIILTN